MYSNNTSFDCGVTFLEDPQSYLHPLLEKYSNLSLEFTHDAQQGAISTLNDFLEGMPKIYPETLIASKSKLPQDKDETQLVKTDDDDAGDVESQSVLEESDEGQGGLPSTIHQDYLEPATDKRVSRTISTAVILTQRAAAVLSDIQSAEASGKSVVNSVKSPFEDIPTTIDTSTQLYPLKTPISINNVYSTTEPVHVQRSARSKLRLTCPFIVSLIAIAVMLYAAFSQLTAAQQLYVLDPINEHFLGWQIGWNTQRYDSFFMNNQPLYWTIPSGAYCIIGLFGLLFRFYRCWTRERDIGYGIVTSRVKCDRSFKVFRVLAWASVIAAYIIGGQNAVPDITNRFYQAQCRVQPLFGREADRYVIDGTAAGDCNVHVDIDILSNERHQIGEIPDKTIGNSGYNVTIYMEPLGTEMGCAAGQSLFSDIPSNYSRTGWLPFVDRPRRRCLSAKGYAFSNWITFAPMCNASTYASWANFTGITSFNHAEQWFCTKHSEDDSITTSLTYDTAGWISSFTGASCLAPNDTNVDPALVAFARVGPNITTQQNAISIRTNSMLLSPSLTGSTTSPPPFCAYAEYACSMTSPGRYVRSVSFHDCAWKVSRPESTAAAQIRLADNFNKWSTLSEYAVVAASADTLMDAIEAVLIYMFF